MRRRDFLAASLASLVPAAIATPALAKFPERSVRLIIPRGAGGVLDVVGRLWCNGIAKSLGVSVYIENIAGAGGAIGVANAAKASADGYSLLLGSTSDIVLLQERKLSFDPEKEFQPVSVIATSAGSLAVNAGLPVNTLGELIDYAKINASTLNYASVGAGTMSHLIMEQFRQQAGLPEILHVPYKTGAGAFNDLVAGIVQMQGLFVTTPTIELHRAGKIKILAAASAKRVAGAPEIPTTAEAGLPNFIAEMTFGIFAPKESPPAIVEAFHAKTQDILAEPDYQHALAKAGLDPVLGSTPASATEYFRQERVRWRPIVDSLSLKEG
ncbi:MAG: tripartite tricarboxylate transporter substrate binding protein [Hyphomicrobiales bacterium]